MNCVICTEELPTTNEYSTCINQVECNERADKEIEGIIEGFPMFQLAINEDILDELEQFIQDYLYMSEEQFRETSKGMYFGDGKWLLSQEDFEHHRLQGRKDACRMIASELRSKRKK